MVICPACRISFTQGGLIRHYRQTENPRCIEVYQQTLDYVPPRREPTHMDLDDGLPQYFDDPASDLPELVIDVDSDSDGELIDVDSDTDEEPGPAADWEPPAAANNGRGSPEQDGEGGEGEGKPVNPAPQIVPENRFVQEPHITKFGGAAGARLPRTEVPAYTQYKAHLAEVDDNPWAPFKSQIDWQLARWAKVRGSTSTAFTDLLAIHGVRRFTVF